MADVEQKAEEPLRTKSCRKKEEKRIARLVQRKLEDYVNRTKREEHFDPAGAVRTTSRMRTYDVMYKAIEATALEKAARKKLKAQKREGNVNLIVPKLEINSRRVTRQAEVVYIAESVTKVMGEVPVKDLTKIHGYKLKPAKRTPEQSSNNKKEPIDIRFQGYTSHVGSILQTKKYVDYYLEQGLNTGNPELSCRLRELKMKERPNSAGSTSTTNSVSSSKRAYTPRCNGSATPSPRYEVIEKISAQPTPNKIDSGVKSQLPVTDAETKEVDNESEDKENATSTMTTSKTDTQIQTSLVSLRESHAQTSFLDSTLDTTLTTSQNESCFPTPGRVDFGRKVDDDNEGQYSDDFEEEDEEEKEFYVDRKQTKKDEMTASRTSVQTYMSTEHVQESAGE